MPVTRGHHGGAAHAPQLGGVLHDPDYVALADAHASALRIVNDLQWLVHQRPDSLRVVEATTQRLRSDLAPVLPAFAPPLRLADLPPDPLKLVYPPRPEKRMARASLVRSYDQRVAQMTPAQRELVDAFFAMMATVVVGAMG